VRERLDELVVELKDPDAPEIRKTRRLSSIHWLNRLLMNLKSVSSTEHLIQKAGSTISVGFFYLLTLTLATMGLLLGTALFQSIAYGVVAALCLSAVPYVSLKLKARKRVKRFMDQLPHALDLMARALRAGHAFPSAMGQVAQEFEEPMGPQFKAVIDEINFGVNVQQALTNMTRRIDCPDLKYFVVSVIVQRETGGNLAEIIESLAHLIRERFKLHQKVRALTAESRLSGVVVTALPFLFAVIVSVIRPGYLSPLFEDPLGKFLIVGGLFMLALGGLVMKRLVNVTV
jgi:tight adherence protein B